VRQAPRRTTIIGSQLVGLALLAVPAWADMSILDPVPELRPGLLQGFLHGQPPLDSKAFVAAPPESGSPAQQADDADNEALQNLRDTPRWTFAAKDADLHFPAAAGIFACAAGVDITEAKTPALFRLMQRSLTDFGLATYPAKTAYQRPRPFLVNKAPICTPQDQEALTTDGSYPSGHSAIGWGWALVLSQLLPERSEAILARGQEYARSRRVCNVHWLSDTQAGMAVGAAVFARLQNDALFVATLGAARKEIELAKPLDGASQACQDEAAALALGH